MRASGETMGVRAQVGMALNVGDPAGRLQLGQDTGVEGRGVWGSGGVDDVAIWGTCVQDQKKVLEVGILKNGYSCWKFATFSFSFKEKQQKNNSVHLRVDSLAPLSWASSAHTCLYLAVPLAWNAVPHGQLYLVLRVQCSCCLLQEAFPDHSLQPCLWFMRIVCVSVPILESKL